MQIVRLLLPFVLLIAVSCGSGGPLTPSDTFKIIRKAADSNDRAVILKNLSAGSIEKINDFIRLTARLSDSQLKALALSENVPIEKISGMKPAECTALYFSRNRYGNSLADIFNEDIVSVDVKGKYAVIKTSGGYELDFVREGPYWKFDITRL
ncbi:MAG TPA: hypothetical protein PK358_03780 [Spirochaetota bacterium]|nr:hypothetical protein [Spirochaetota bacterium]HPJ33927.1 hypothetical protein [Spirochaetota bacterium]